MFQNAKIAKDHGDNVRKAFEGSDRDYVRKAAAEAGRQAEAIKLANLDKWVRDNVGLN
jgi:hypothetical protein